MNRCLRFVRASVAFRRAVETAVLVIFSGTALSQTESQPPLSRNQALDYLRRHTRSDDAAWLRAATKAQLNGCQFPAHDGTVLFAPDGSDHYRALWTRDFAYMVEHAGDLMDPKLTKAAILFLLAGRRDDGCMPDRVTASGQPVYSPGPADHGLADHALDNGPFMAKLVAAYVRFSGDLDFFRRHEPALRKGLDFVPRADNGLVYNDPANPQCPYGFTDTVVKTGCLLFTSLLYYDACVKMHDLTRQASCGQTEVYQARAALIRKNLATLWDDKAGMFLAADHDCRQIDIWGSALAVDLEVVSGGQRDRIIDYLAAHTEAIFKRGQVRHLPGGEHWSRLFIAVPPGTYQNGAYWATPHAWLLPALARRQPALAARLLSDTIADFRANGINECVNDHYKNVPDYVASAAAVYTLFAGELPASQPSCIP